MENLETDQAAFLRGLKARREVQYTYFTVLMVKICVVGGCDGRAEPRICGIHFKELMLQGKWEEFIPYESDSERREPTQPRGREGGTEEGMESLSEVRDLGERERVP